MPVKFKVLRDITETPVMLGGITTKITIPKGAICTETGSVEDRMTGKTSVVSWTIDNIKFPLSWLKKDEYDEEPYIEQIETSGGRRRRTKRRRTSIKHKNKKRKTRRS